MTSKQQPCARPLLGVVHLAALPSAERHVSMSAVLDAAIGDALVYTEAGFDGLVVDHEVFGIKPLVDIDDVTRGGGVDGRLNTLTGVDDHPVYGGSESESKKKS